MPKGEKAVLSKAEQEPSSRKVMGNPLSRVRTAGLVLRSRAPAVDLDLGMGSLTFSLRESERSESVHPAIEEDEPRSERPRGETTPTVL